MFAINKIIPSVILPLRLNPMPPIRNAGLGLFENPISLSHSSFEILPERYKSLLNFTPIGKPHIRPQKYAFIAAGEIFRNREKNLFSTLILSSLT